MNKIDSQYIKNRWYQIAVDYDYNISIDTIRSYYSDVSWRDDIFNNLKVGFKNRFELYPDFFKIHDYSWVLDKDSYDFIAEPFYQLIVLDTLIGIWESLSSLEGRSSKFDNIVIRQAIKWSGQKISPRAIPGKNLQIIVIPFGWDDCVWLIVEGFLQFCNPEIVIPFSNLSCENKKNAPDENNSYIKYWKALVARIISDKMNCPDVFSSSFVSKLNREIKELKCDIKHMKFDKFRISTSQVYSNNITSYAIGHEVGHFLRGLKDDLDDNDLEVSADKYAYAGLFNCSLSFNSYFEIEENEKVLLMISSLFFLYSIIMLKNVESNISFPKNESIISESMEIRLKSWIHDTSEICNNLSEEYVLIFEKISLLNKELCHYLKSFHEFNKDLFPKVINHVETLLKKVSEENNALNTIINKSREP